MDFLQMLRQETDILTCEDKEPSGLKGLSFSTRVDKSVKELAPNENGFHKKNKRSVVLIALCGESAAGKTTLLNRLKAKNNNISVISADNYYKDISDLIERYGSFTHLVESGYDSESASAFEMSRLITDLKTLKKGDGIWMPFYDMSTGKSIPHARWFQPQEIVIVEGICTFYEPIRDLFDLKIYLQADKERQKRRYFERAVERGQNPNEIQRQFEMVCLAAQKNIIPNQKYADLVVKLKPENAKSQQRDVQTISLIPTHKEPTLKCKGKNANVGKEQTDNSFLESSRQTMANKKSDGAPHCTSIYDPKLWEYYLGRSRENN